MEENNGHLRGLNLVHLLPVKLLHVSNYVTDWYTFFVLRLESSIISWAIEEANLPVTFIKHAVTFLKLKIHAAENYNGHWMAGVCGWREDSEFCWWHVKKHVFMGCPRLLPKANKKLWFKDKYFSFITWYNYLHTCPSCALRVGQNAVGPQFSPWRLTSFWIYMLLGKRLFMLYCFFTVLSLSPWLWNTR